MEENRSVFPPDDKDMISIFLKLYNLPIYYFKAVLINLRENTVKWSI